MQWRIAERLLRRELGVQMQITAIGRAIAQIGFDALFEWAQVPGWLVITCDLVSIQ